MTVTLSERVKRIARIEGISEQELLEMIRRSAPCTHDRGNRRFHTWVFSIDKRTNECEDMASYEFFEEGQPGMRGWVFEEHLACSGEGCRDCGWWGEVRRYL